MRENRWLIDTCILADLVNPKIPTPCNVVEWLEENRSVIFISALTLHEMCFGSDRMCARKSVEDQIRGARIAEANEVILNHYFSGHILLADARIAARSGLLRAVAEPICGDIGPVDALIAATADFYDLHVVTHNTRHFLAAGVKVIEGKAFYTVQQAKLRIVQ